MWINLCRIVRDVGSIDLLFPDWCDNVIDMPWTIVQSFERARIILALHERPDDFRIPPKRIWLNDEKLDAYIKDENNRIEFERENGKGAWDPTRVDGPVMTQDVEIFSEDAPIPG